MKQTLVLSCLLTMYFGYSQTITPAVTTEQCPGATIVFTVTVAANSITSLRGTALNISPTVVKAPYNVVSTSGAITFNFDGRFADYNNKQTLRFIIRIIQR